jgi:putative lipoic acid-binding regulatory protein
MIHPHSTCKVSLTFFSILQWGFISGFRLDCTWCRILHHYYSPPPTTSQLYNTANNVRNEIDDDSDANIENSPPKRETWEELPERFKYQVQALMGNFDPVGAAADDERQNGNILRAMLQFPTQYTFNVVGKTMGDPVLEHEYTVNVQRIVQETTGDEGLSCESIARGMNFTKVQCVAVVQSVAIVNNVYDELGGLELTVMRF